MSSEISTALLPFVSHQAVAVLLIIENSYAMACDWIDVRDRYVRTMIESLKAANATVPMEIQVLTTLPLNAEHVSCQMAIQHYNDLKDVEFNRSAENLVTVEHVYRGIEHLVTSEVGSRPTTVRHIFIVAATSPSESFERLDTDGRPQWKLVSEKLAEAHIYHHLIANVNQDMTALDHLFEETLLLQGNVENKAHVKPWNSTNSQSYTVRLASRTQVQICATTHVRGKPYTVSRNGKEPASRNSPPLRKMLSPETAEAPSTSARLDAPSLVAQLQKVHGLVKKKVHSVPPPRAPFFKDKLVKASQASSYTAGDGALTPPEVSNEGGRVRSQLKADRSSRIRGKTSRTRAQTIATLTRATSPLSSSTRSGAKGREMGDHSGAGTPLVKSRPRSKSNAASSALSPASPITTTTSFDIFHQQQAQLLPQSDVHPYPSQYAPSLSSDSRTVYLPVPPYYPSSEVSPTNYDTTHSQHFHGSHFQLPVSPRPYASPQLHSSPDLSHLTSDEAFMRSTKAIIAKMAPDRDLPPSVSALHMRQSAPEVLNSGGPRHRANTLPIPLLPDITSQLSSPAPVTLHISHSAGPVSPIPTTPTVDADSRVSRQSPVVSTLLDQDKTPSATGSPPSLPLAGYWHDMNFLFGPNNPNPDIEGLPLYPTAVNDRQVAPDYTSFLVCPHGVSDVAVPLSIESGNPSGIPALYGDDPIRVPNFDVPPSYTTSVDWFPPFDLSASSPCADPTRSFLDGLAPSPSYLLSSEFNSDFHGTHPNADQT